MHTFFFPSFLSFCLLLCCGVQPLSAEEKTPNDVFGKVLIIRSQVEKLRGFHQVDNAWPVVSPQTHKTPSHVLQKCFEVMKKINHLRRIEDLGEITIPPYPSRNISPNEVYDMVQRLEQELSLLLKYKYGEQSFSSAPPSIIGKTSNHVYRALWEISYAMNPLLGMRGVSPNEVYALSEQILAEIRFLRNSQNISAEVSRPPLSIGRHPNHALHAASNLMGTIARAQKNLWLIPAIPNLVPRQVITIADVYDGLLGVQAELQRIKYRLGLERTFPLVEMHKRYDADDIIRNLQWAKALMPLFPLEKSLSQYDQKSLIKTPSHVYQVTDHILWELQNYKKQIGIQQAVDEELPLVGLAPQHVYGKTLECLRQVSALRSSKDLGPIAIPTPPLRIITPDEVFELVTRLDMELEVLYRSGQVEAIPWYEDYRDFVYGKTPSNVYNQMRKIAREIDILLGNHGYNINDSYMLAEKIKQELALIQHHLDVGGKEPQVPLVATPLQPYHILSVAHELWDLVKQVQRRAGIHSPFISSILPSASTTPTDVYNELQLILTEIEGLKLHLRMTSTLPQCQKVEGKISNLIEQSLRQSMDMLSVILGQVQKEVVK